MVTLKQLEDRAREAIGNKCPKAHCTDDHCWYSHGYVEWPTQADVDRINAREAHRAEVMKKMRKIKLPKSSSGWLKCSQCGSVFLELSDPGVEIHPCSTKSRGDWIRHSGELEALPGYYRWKTRGFPAKIFPIPKPFSLESSSFGDSFYRYDDNRPLKRVTGRPGRYMVNVYTGWSTNYIITEKQFQEDFEKTDLEPNGWGGFLPPGKKLGK